MWKLLKRSDIGAARQQLTARRAELLRRQAEELAQLAADEADLEVLHRLAGAFSAKFKKPAAAAPVAAVTVTKDTDPPVTPHQYGGSKPPPRSAHAARRGVAGTNFEVFSRAISKSAF